MAMSMKTESLPEESEEYLFICGICLCNFDDPKALPCLHTFCCECIRQWATHGQDIKAEQTIITCPNCRRKARIPPGGVDQLPTNFYIPHLTKKSATKLPCCMSCAKPEGTELGLNVEGRCKDCGWLCEGCLASHKSLNVFKNHEVLRLDSLRSGRAAPTVSASNESTKSEQNYGEWKFDKKIGKFKEARCVAVAPNGDIAVTEETEKGQVHILSKDGNHKFVLDTTIGLLPGKKSKPFGVAVDRRGFFYVTDSSPWVRVYSDSGTYLYLFQTVLPKNCDQSKSDAECLGVAISHEQHVFVGESTMGYISVHKADGTHVTSFLIRYRPLRFFSFLGNTIAISKWGSENVLLLDSKGNLKTNIVSPSVEVKLQTGGVCLTRNKELMVVNTLSTSREKCSVLRYSMSGNYLGCITKGVQSESCGICETIIDDTKKLLIVSKKTVSIFRWVETC